MKVDFYIAGTQKSGTTHLSYILSRSSEICIHPQIECTFFFNQEEYNRGIQYLKRNYFFHYRNHSSKRILIKHSYSYTRPDVLQRALQHNPHIQIILIFRNPIKRFLSSYQMEVTRSLYPYDLHTAVKKALKEPLSVERKVFFELGLYDYWLEQIMPIIPSSQLHLFLFEELYNDTTHHISEFAKKFNLNIDTSVIHTLEIQNSHKVYRNYWIQRFIRKLKRLPVKNYIKRIIPPPLWVSLTQQIEHVNLIEPDDFFKIDTQIKEILKEQYALSIERFEKITGFQTNWLQS